MYILSNLFTNIYMSTHIFTCASICVGVRQASEESEQVSSYDQLVRQLMSNEEKYISQLNLILKIFQEPFIKRPDLFPPKVGSLVHGILRVHSTWKCTYVCIGIRFVGQSVYCFHSHDML